MFDACPPGKPEVAIFGVCEIGCVLNRGETMPDHVYKTIELVGSSTKGMEDAVQKAIAKAAQTVRNLRWFEVVDTRGHIEKGRVAHWQVTLKLGFTLEDE
jgi:flavin-binding protein dodecin